MTYNVDIGTFLLALGGLILAWRQLGSIKEQLVMAVKNQKNDTLKVVLEIETQMNQRKLEYDKASKAIREAEEEKLSVNKLEILADYLGATKESYLNVLDRLCYCIAKEYLDDKDWRAEYRNMLRDTIQHNPDDFNEASPYRNIKAINSKWQTE